MKDYHNDDLEGNIYPVNSLNLEVSETDPDYQEALRAEEPKILDPDFFNLLNKTKLGEPLDSDKVYERVIKFYDKKYRYQILWRKIRIKIQDLKDFIYEHLLGKLEVVFASVLLLAILGGVAYYQYGAKGINQGHLISNQHTPIKTSTPKPATKLESTTSPNNIVENNNHYTELNDNNNIDNTNNKKRKDDFVANNGDKSKKTLNLKQNRKFEPITNIEKEHNQISSNSQTKITPISGLRGATKDTHINNIKNKQINNLGQVHKISVDLFATIRNQNIIISEPEKHWLEQLNGILVKEINQLKGKYQWEIVSEEEAEVGLQLDNKEQVIFLVNLSGEEIWRMSLTDYAKESSEITANKIIQQLKQNILASLNNKN